ncbi:HNH endonuclease [Mitsuaria sp. PDC51]|uniref:HNH endonuclease n=1 Tax=Mitsuaria sp. PDC51 TaxID=1881035 RepID=UPI0008F0F7BB|nr:HNH endonuclease signature motif containing protein [Mitsuaria sp. PDC51]SFR74935.1 HNH endonuclease [Mitsuaria sp. PDC51]
MAEIKNYSGPKLNDFAERTRASLRAAGFDIVALPSSNPNRKRNLIRVLWDGVYVGQMHSDLWDHGYGCLYRFNSLDGAGRLRFAEPKEYGAEDFMRIHHLDESQFSIRAEGKDVRRYYRIVGTEATLKVMKQSAQWVDGALGLGAEDDIARDIAEIEKSNLSATDKDALIKVRLGQGTFRAALGKEFNWTCPSSGMNLRAALRASHIVPWREANAEERRDPLNGLLLSANLDALFDKHLLTFSRTGSVKFAKSVPSEVMALLGPFGKLKFKPCASRASYLARHHKRFEELELQRVAIAKARDEEGEADEE